MEEDSCAVLGTTASDISCIKKDVLGLGTVLESDDSQRLKKNVDDSGFAVNQMQSEVSQMSCGTLHSDLNNIKDRLSEVVNSFSLYSRQMRSMLADEKLFDISCRNSAKAEERFVYQIGQFAKGLQNGLFAEIRELSTVSLEETLSGFIDHYNELKMKYAELLVTSSQTPAKKGNLLDETSVFELLEKELSNCDREKESIRSNYESKISCLTADWEYQRSKLLTDIRKREGLIDEFQQQIEDKENENLNLKGLIDEFQRKIEDMENENLNLKGLIDEFQRKIEDKENENLKLKGELDETARQFCCKENVDFGPNRSLNQLRSFLTKLEKRCPWLWDLFYGRNNQEVDSVLMNPVEQKKSLNKAILERNELEDELHRLKQELLSLKDTRIDLANQLKTKNDELQYMCEKFQKQEERLTEYRIRIQKLCDPQVASAFAETIRKNVCAGKSDSHITSYTVSSTPSSGSLSSSRTEPDISLTTVSILPSNKTPLNTKPSEAQPASIFHCVGAAVTAIANVITSPKRPQASPVNSSENKRSRPDLSPPKSDNTPTEMSIAEPSLAVKAEEKPIPCDSVPRRVSHPALSTKSNHFAVPERPIFSSSSSQETALGLPVKSTTARRPLTELPVSRPKSPIAVTSSSGDLPTPSGYLTKDNHVQNYPKADDFKPYSFPPKGFDVNVSFLNHLPLAESTTHMQRNTPHSTNRNFGKDFDSNRPAAFRSPNEKNELFAVPSSKPTSSWQVPRSGPMKQNPTTNAFVTPAPVHPQQPVQNKDEPLTNQRCERKSVSRQKRPSNAGAPECKPS